jgi:hypothetical protein
MKVSHKLAHLTFLSLAVTTGALAQDAHPNTVSIDWSKPIATSKTELTLQFCPYPQMRRENPIHDKVFKAMRDLHANYNRFQPWFEYPRMYVAELEPPANGKTHWDFSLMDGIMEDFMAAANGKSVVMNIGAVPAWMYKTESPVRYPQDPDEIDPHYADNGEHNLRYHVLTLLRENFPPGVRLFRAIAPKIEDLFRAPSFFCQGFMGSDGTRKILIVNKRDKPAVIDIPKSAGGVLQLVDGKTANRVVRRTLTADSLTLGGLAVAVVTLPH